MSSRLMLLVALAACLRFGSAQSEPLPPSLVDMVMNSPISSMEDLQKLLDVDSVEEEEDEVHFNGTHRRLPRSLVGVQVAQQAMCKVRTEVMEVTRSMLDRRNANFLLWPLCVEVQRCSGCCNSRTMQCVPIATEMRHLQMTKIQFVNREPIYEKVIIPVEDHVRCSCQSRAAAPAPRAKATPPAPPPRVLPKVVPRPSQSKEELHRNDDLKQNQRLHLEDGEPQQLQWQTRYAPAHTQGAPAYTQSHWPSLTHTPAAPAHVSREDTWTRRVTPGALPVPGDGRSDGQHDRPQEHHTHLGSGDGKGEQHHQQRPHPHFQSDEATPQLPHRKLSRDSSQSHSTVPHHSQSVVVPPQSSQLEAPVLTYTHVEVIGQSSGQSKLPNNHFAQLVTPSIHSSPSAVDGQPHSQSDHAERREKATELQRSDRGKSDVEHEHKQSHHHHQNGHQAQASGNHQSGTPRAVTNAPQTTSPTPHPPPPPTTQRRRRKKHRRRISKSAMRAMIMVMS